MLRPIHIAFVELKRYIADRGSLAFGIALPIVLFALMYAAFGGEVSFSGAAHVVDLDKGPMAEKLVERLEEVEGLKVKMYTEKDADGALDRSAILTAVVIPAGFSAALEAGEPVSIKFKQRGSGGDEGQIVASIVRGAAQSLAGEVQVRNQVSRAMQGSSLAESQIDAKIDALLAEARANPPVSVSSRTIGGSEGIVEHMLAGILVMFLLFAVAMSAQTLVEERRLGTLERLLTTRLTVNQLFLGKFLAGVARAVFQAVILLALAFAVLGVAGVSEFFQMLLFSLVIAASVSAVALVIAAVARTLDQAIWAAVFFTMYMTVFGGTFIEVGDTGILALLARFTLNKYAIDGLENIITGSGALAQQGLEMAVLGGIAVAALALARLLFRATEGGR